MADTGMSAALSISVIGRVAIDPLAEVDLAIDPAGDLLAIDSVGDVLIVTPAATWPGKSAEESV